MVYWDRIHNPFVGYARPAAKRNGTKNKLTDKYLLK